MSTSLDCVIDKVSLSCLNEDSAHPIGNCFRDDDSFLQSNADHQLLVHIPFVEPVHVSGLRMLAAGDEAPSTIRMFVNRPGFGFDDCDWEVSMQDINLRSDDVDNNRLFPLRAAKFQGVHSLQIFVQENHGAEVTKITRLELFGIKTGISGKSGGRGSVATKAKRRASHGSAKVGGASVATQLMRLSSGESIAQQLEEAGALGPRGRDFVREGVIAYLSVEGHVGDGKRRALLILEACKHLSSRCEGPGSNARNKARLMATQGLMAGLEEMGERVEWTPGEVIRKAPPWAALQILRTMPLQSFVSEVGVLKQFLFNVMTGKTLKPEVVILVGEWIAAGLADPTITDVFRELASLFGTLAARWGKLDDRWCEVAVAALKWLPEDFQSEQLIDMAGRVQADPPGNSVGTQEWSVDLMSLPAYKIPGSIEKTWVDTIDGLEHLAKLVAASPAVAIDTEFGCGSALALIQIAFAESCYLVDARPSLGTAYHDSLRSTLQIAFDRVVFGWSFREDARRLVLSASCLAPVVGRVKDLQPIARRRLGLLQTPSLQRACAELVGVALDKGEQRSDWDQRPLTSTQSYYAACDAVVLFHLAHALGEQHGFAVNAGADSGADE